MSLRLHRGEIVGLIGPNGSGKTTLVNIVSGLYQADAGRLAFRGRDITNQAAHLIARLGIARTFQHIVLADDLTALDNIAVARATRERSGLGKSILTLGPDPCLAAARGQQTFQPPALPLVPNRTARPVFQRRGSGATRAGAPPLFWSCIRGACRACGARGAETRTATVIER